MREALEPQILWLVTFLRMLKVNNKIVQQIDLYEVSNSLEIWLSWWRPDQILITHPCTSD